MPLKDINGRALELAILMGGDHKLAFEPWEVDLLREIAFRHPGNHVAVTSADNRLVAGVIGGLCGKRGTISHAWVHPDSRGLRIGDALALRAAQELVDAGAKVIHLIVTAGNDDAVNFWSRLGYKRVGDRVTLEGDIDPDLDITESFEEISDVELHSIIQDEVERQHLQEFLKHHSTFFVSRDVDGISGFVAVGSLGVRGIIERYWAKTPELACALIRQAFGWLRANGVGRVHAFVAPEDPGYELLLSCGMRENPGETTMEFIPARQSV